MARIEVLFVGGIRRGDADEFLECFAPEVRVESFSEETTNVPATAEVLVDDGAVEDFLEYCDDDVAVHRARRIEVA